MIIYVLIDEENLRERMEYSIATALSTAGFFYRFISELKGEEGMMLRYGSGSRSEEFERFAHNGGVLIDVFCCRWLYRPEENLNEFQNIERSLRFLNEIPFWGSSEGDELLSLRKLGRGAICELRVDILGNIFYHLSKIEEFYCEKRGDHGRFESKESLLGKSGLLHRPIVDEYVGLLIKILVECCRLTGNVLVRKDFWPAGKKFAVCLSHDVDLIAKWTPKRIAYEIWESIKSLASFRPIEAQRKLWTMASSVLKRQNPYWNFEELLADEEEFGIRSSFYFATERKSKYDPGYSLTDSKILEMIENLTKGGWEIGLHGTYDSYNRINQLRDERVDFESATKMKAWGVRQHYLRFDFQETLRNQELLSFEYDCTLGYADGEGFRAGISFPFHPFDHEKGERMNLMEIPLSLMDKTLTNYRAYNEDEAKEEVRRLFENVKENGGLFSFLQHQSSFDETEYPYSRKLYRELLKWASEENVYCATAKEIRDWWVNRESFNILEANWGRDRLEFCLITPKSVDGISLIVAPLQKPDGYGISATECEHQEHYLGDVLRLDLRGVEENRIVKIRVDW